MGNASSKENPQKIVKKIRELDLLDPVPDDVGEEEEGHQQLVDQVPDRYMVT